MQGEAVAINLFGEVVWTMILLVTAPIQLVIGGVVVDVPRVNSPVSTALVKLLLFFAVFFHIPGSDRVSTLSATGSDSKLRATTR